MSQILDRINAGYVIAFFMLLPLLSHAGGLGIAAFAAIGGGIAIVTGSRLDLKNLPLWVPALALFTAWAWITALWSPYDDPHTMSNPAKMALGVVAFLFFIAGIIRASEIVPKTLKHLLMAMMVLSVGLLIIDLLSGYGLTFMADPMKESETLVRKQNDAEMNLGHGITVLAIMSVPVMVLMSRTFKYGRFYAAGFAALILISGVLGNLAIGIVSLLGAVIAMGLASLWPRGTIIGITVLGAAGLILAPLGGFASARIPQSMKDALPFSWEHRIEMWAYTAQRIMEKPFFGHGFDASRTFDATFSSRGFENLDLIWLHPHSAGLQIWAETGFIGGLLAGITVALLGHDAWKTAKGKPAIAVPLAGVMASATIICAVTYGVWQYWWWASIAVAISALFICIADNGPANKAE